MMVTKVLRMKFSKIGFWRACVAGLLGILAVGAAAQTPGYSLLDWNDLMPEKWVKDSVIRADEPEAEAKPAAKPKPAPAKIADLDDDEF